MRVLVTGGGGQVAVAVAAAWTDAGDDVVAAGRAVLDVGDRDAVLGTIASSAPDVVVHAGAWTAVDDCEADPDRAYRANALGARHVAEACALAGAHLVHLSTDYVFDGTSARPYVEWDSPNPQSVYGCSKLGGETEVRALLPTSTIVRTSWVCSGVGRNMVRTVASLLTADPRRELAFVDDQHGCPTFTDDLAVALRALASRRLPGTFHVTNQGATTWYRFVQAIVVAAGGSADQVRSITTADLDPPRPAPRPANSVLDHAALRLSGLTSPPHWSEPLDRVVKELLS